VSRRFLFDCFKCNDNDACDVTRASLLQQIQPWHRVLCRGAVHGGKPCGSAGHSAEGSGSDVGQQKRVTTILHGSSQIHKRFKNCRKFLRAAAADWMWMMDVDGQHNPGPPRRRYRRRRWSGLLPWDPVGWVRWDVWRSLPLCASWPRHLRSRILAGRAGRDRDRDRDRRCWTVAASHPLSDNNSLAQLEKLFIDCCRVDP
jgi:hypothetical protein